MNLLPLLLGAMMQAAPPAFPQAEGFGANTPGGRGGDVYHVTTLKDSGPGSLRHAIQSATGPRTILFDLSGNIVLESPLSINRPFLTLAGQTAPGDGITVTGWTTSITDTHDVVIRYLRFCAGDTNCPKLQGDTLTVDRSTDVLIDHVSASWSVDETLSVTDSDRVTVQWSPITESLNQSCHEKGEHGYASLVRYGTGGVTFHHNLFAHHHSRNPRLGDDIALDFVNNVIYNYGYDGGQAGYSGEDSEGSPRLNFVGNYLIAGPSTDASRRTRAFVGGGTKTRIFQAANLIDGNRNSLRDGVNTEWAMIQGVYTREGVRFEFPMVRTEEAAAAYRRILASAGASFARDAVDARIVAEVASDGGRVIDSPKDVGGLPALRRLAAPFDTDQDGIPDAWETAHQLDPRDPTDAARITASGYSNLERYLEALVSPQTALVDDTFDDGESQRQDPASNSLRVFNGRAGTVRTDSVGAVQFDVTNAGGSEAFWAFFTAAGSPVTLGVGDRLSVSTEFAVNGLLNNGQDIRFGIFDSLGTRNSANLTGGMNDATFINDPGYGLDFFASGAGSPFVLGRRTALAGANIFNNFGDFSSITGSGAAARQTLKDDTPYRLTYTIERLTATQTRLTAEVSGDGLTGLNYSAVETSPTPAASFDYFAFRITGPAFAPRISFSRLLVEYTPALPVITSQPQPSSLLVQVGGRVSLSVGASGSGLTYQWRRDSAPLATANAPTLVIPAVQRTDAGTYTVAVSNAGGTVISNPVTLGVSETPVPPPPSITAQPMNTTVVVGASATLSVTAAGSNLSYQWFKGGALIPGATASTLRFANAQVSDTGSYSVSISNTSGSIASTPATLTVVSAMSVIGFSPAAGATNVCADSTLAITFDRPVRAGRSGRLRVIARSGAVADTIDLAASPQSRVIGGTSFNYFPVIVDANTATIVLHQPLALNETYTITVDPGVFLDADGAPFEGVAGTWRFTTRLNLPAPGSDLTVAADGSADFCTVQGAIDHVPENNAQPVIITVLSGTYHEINYVRSNKPFLTIRGEDRDATIIRYSNNANLNAGNPRAMFGVDAADFTLEDITLWNTTPRGGSQAEAFRGNNRRILLNRVTLRSFQDTLLLQGTGFVTDSLIEGDVDFMWGNGAVFFQNSELRAVTSGGFYAQVRNGKGQNGHVYSNSRLTSAEGVSNVYLARIDPIVFPDSQVIFINCAMGPHIAPAGWLLNNATTAPSVLFGEYQTTGLDGEALDVSRRAPFSRQLTAEEAGQWSDPAFVLGGWTPFTINVTGSVATWTAPPGHSPLDRIAAYRPGDPDDRPVAWLYTGPRTTGVWHLPPMERFELRYLPHNSRRPIARAAARN